jgi:hypothetical protein
VSLALPVQAGFRLKRTSALANPVALVNLSELGDYYFPRFFFGAGFSSDLPFRYPIRRVTESPEDLGCSVEASTERLSKPGRLKTHGRTSGRERRALRYSAPRHRRRKNAGGSGSSYPPTRSTRHSVGPLSTALRQRLVQRTKVKTREWQRNSQPTERPILRILCSYLEFSEVGATPSNGRPRRIPEVAMPQSALNHGRLSEGEQQIRAK